MDTPTVAVALRFLSSVVPKASAQLRRWRTRAASIPDADVRREALSSLRHKAFHVHGASVFATFLPPAAATRFISLVAAYETAVDYLDNLCDRIGSADEKDFRALHESLLDAIEPGAPLRAYFRSRNADDGGYLNELVLESQACFAALPSYASVREGIVDVTQRYCELQAVKHLAPGTREQRCEAAFSSLSAHLRWWEAAAASGSTMATFALAYAASETALSTRAAREIHDAYFPYFTALHILLDYFVDQDEDRAHDELNFVACYPSAQAAYAGIERIAAQAVRRVNALPDGQPHIFALRAMCGYYCTRPTLSRDARSAAAEIMREAGVDIDPQPLLELYTRMAGL